MANNKKEEHNGIADIFGPVIFQDPAPKPSNTFPFNLLDKLFGLGGSDKK